MREECPVCGELFYAIEGLHPYRSDDVLCCSVRCADEWDRSADLLPCEVGYGEE